MMNEKKIQTIEKIYRLAQQDAEFNAALMEKLGNVKSSGNAIVGDQRIDAIYEFCIEKVIQAQADNFYSDFPISSLKSTLIHDYCRMEAFRRKDNFGDFCLALYQQIECISNCVCNSKELDRITQKMWAYPAYVKSDPKKDSIISDRPNSSYTIADLIFIKNKDRVNTALQNQYATDKVRIVVYFLGFKATMQSTDYNTFVEITNLLGDIYQCRNTNHRGNNLYDWQQKIIDRIAPLKSLYYFKFLGALAQFVEFVKTGWPELPRIRQYADSLLPRKINIGVKVVGKIDLDKIK